MSRTAWNHPSLTVRSDLPWQAQYRRLQSWYRETVLGLPPGKDNRGITRGNMLPANAVARNPGLNFLDDDIAAYAYERMAGGGTIDRDRLKRNMLSSMPLCFNLFGALRRHPAAARGLRAVLGLDIDEVLEISVEWAPDPSAHLRDRTAFDAFVDYRTACGSRAFVGVETKYIENPFDEEPYDRQLRHYAAVTRDPASGFRSGAESRLIEPPTNQLWRNALLVHSLRSTDEFDDGHMVVLSSAENESVSAATKALSRELHDPPQLLRSALYEDLIAALSTEPELSSWAGKFRRRYLDLSPVRL